MTGAWSRILEKYGQKVAVYKENAETGTVCRAFLQPALERRGEGYQTLPTPLGLVRQISGSTWAVRRCPWMLWVTVTWRGGRKSSLSAPLSLFTWGMSWPIGGAAGDPGRGRIRTAGE